MNILHLSAQKPDSTGSGVYLRETVAALARAGHNQAVIAGIAPEDDPQLAPGVLFRPVRFQTTELPFPVVGMSDVMPYTATRYRDLTPEMTEQFKVSFEQAIDDVLDRFTPDLIICHHLYLVCSVLTHLVHERKQSDSALAACTVCGLSHSTDIRQMRQIPLERDFIRAGIKMLDRVYALHEAQAREIEEVYGIDSARIRVVGTGYDAGEFFVRPGLRKPGTAKLVFVGKVCYKKGVGALLSALDNLTVRIPNVELTLVGGYSDKQEHDMLVQYAREHSLPVTFAGKLPHDDLVRAYNEADVFVLPSFYEGLPLVIVEALACGCKVVCTALPGIRPWIEANVDGNAVTFVEPPRMHDVDTPVDEDLPAFEARLCDALEHALTSPPAACDTTRASWDALAARLL